MATRATISIEGTKTIVYKHWDGYPEGMIPWLLKFNSQFSVKRGDDPSYKLAQLLRSSVTMGKEFQLDESEFTGYGVFEKFDDCGQEFSYILFKDGSVGYIAAPIDPSLKKNKGKIKTLTQAANNVISFSSSSQDIPF
jgi:hypothetical protein